jgi:hypothetical protein
MAKSMNKCGYVEKLCIILILSLCSFISVVCLFIFLINWTEKIEIIHQTDYEVLLPSSSNETLPSFTCEDAYYHNNISDHKFVLALSYWEQLTMATTSLYDLVEFAKDWNARAVQPFTLLAEFWGLPSTANYPTIKSMPRHILSQKDKLTHKLDNIFNMSVLNSDILCGKFNYPPLASFDEFINTAHRDIVLLHFNFDETPESDYFKDNHCIDCWLIMKEFRTLAKKLLQNLNRISNKYNKPSFRIINAFCFNHLHITTPKEIAKLCGFHDSDNITIIITVWRGYSDIPTKTFRLIVHKHALEQRPSLFSSGGLYALNDNVLSNSSAYLRKISHGKPFIAVHIRTEKMNKHMSNACFHKVWKLISLLKIMFFEDIDIKYFVDYGQFGSFTADDLYITRLIKYKYLKHKKIIPLHYNPKEFGGLADQGFVALVELSTIARAKVLLLVGGGSFQDQIYMNFKRNQNAAVAYKVCWTSKQEILEINVTRHH